MTPLRASPPVTASWENVTFDIEEGVATVRPNHLGKLHALAFAADGNLRVGPEAGRER
jgi:hypothetical protein